MANNGTYYSVNLLCNGASSDDALNVCSPRSNLPTGDQCRISQIPGEKILRGSNCSSFKKGIFPFDPAGTIWNVFTRTCPVILVEIFTLRLWQMEH